MKNLYFKLFKPNVYNRYKTIVHKQSERLRILTEIRESMIYWDKFYFDMPPFKRREFRERLNLPDDENTTKLFIRLTAPVYKNPERLKTLAKEFPLDNLDVNFNKPYLSTW